MELTTTIKAMLASGCSAEQIASVVEAYEAKEQDKAKERRAKRAAAKREERSRRLMSPNVAATTCDNVRQNATTCDIPFPSSPSPNGFPPTQRDNTTTTPLSLTSTSSSKPLNFDHFENFWAAYPRKVGKGQAKRAWNLAIKKAKSEEIISACKSYHWPSEIEFIPHASTWLNGERWADERPKKEVSFLSAPLKPQKRPVEPVDEVISDEDRAKRKKQVDELLKGIF